MRRNRNPLTGRGSPDTNRSTSARRTLVLLGLSGLLLLAACGGGGSTSASQGGPQSLSIGSVPAMDGTVWPLRVSVDPTQRLLVGRAGSNFADAAWGYCTFDLSGIPAGATITSARLELFQRGGYGTASQALPVLIDHMRASGQTPDYAELMGATFELESPMRDAQGNARPLTHTDQRNVRPMDVTAQVRRDLNEGRSLTRFRLRPENNPSTYAYVDFTDAENAWNELPPRLIVDYQ
jgi:hypothetical protein